MSVFDLREAYLWLDGAGGVVKQSAGKAFWDSIAQNPHVKETLVSVFDNDSDWPVWERHPSGGEVLVSISGVATIILEAANGLEEHVMRPGDALVIPAGIWHTARVQEVGRMLFLTFGEGTEHRPV